MTPAGVRISTVGLGSDFDDVILRDIASRGGGSFHAVDDPAKLPQVFRRRGGR
jgi:Ca-activated chloride channel homolog